MLRISFLFLLSQPRKRAFGIRSKNNKLGMCPAFSSLAVRGTRMELFQKSLIRGETITIQSFRVMIIFVFIIAIGALSALMGYWYNND